ncbi:MAG: hypothetical protein JWL72_1585 [Ilumatobacteraceae bacterium]|nr:hypothetical protein [Ilumatobacteraceae bacterium]
MPMTIDRWTVIDGEEHGDVLDLMSTAESDPARITLPVTDPASTEPAWARYVAAVAAEIGDSTRAVRATITTDIPIGAGLSSSAALEVAAALALGFEGDAPALAELCRRAEHRASGVPCGIMDQLCIAAGRAGHALLIDCTSLQTVGVPLPPDLDVVVRFVAHRTLIGSEYVDRVAQCALAAQAIGPLREADMAAVDQLKDDVLHRRARHVITENQRVRDFADALRLDDRVAAGRLMTESHASLRDDFETSTSAMDAAVASLTAVPGVHGARMTGGGFGGCIVAIAERGAVTDPSAWIVHAVDGAIADSFNEVGR